MPILIHVSQEKVIIPQYKLAFEFHRPPAKLTQAATLSYQYLRQSVSLQLEPTGKEREEAISLLQKFGYSLFLTIIPKELHSNLYQEGSIYIHCIDSETDSLPWELLYDGHSFCSFTQGISRLVDPGNSNTQITPDQPLKNFQVSLNSACPFSGDHPIIRREEKYFHGNRFICNIDELLQGSIRNSPYLQVGVQAAATEQKIIQSLATNPQVFLFSGYSGSDYWLLEDEIMGGSRAFTLDHFSRILPKAIYHGLRILFLVTSDLLDSNHHTAYSKINHLINLGIPIILSVHGRLARMRLTEYFRHFIYQLLRQNSVMGAHRSAINAIFSSLPYSWDWSWIQIRQNFAQLSTNAYLPNRPFEFAPSFQEHKKSTEARLTFLNHRRFNGSCKTLMQLNRRLFKNTPNEAICIQSFNHQSIEIYFQEIFRRFDSNIPTIALLFYHRWGYFKGEENNLLNSKFNTFLSTLYETTSILPYFDQCVSLTVKGEKNSPKYLIVWNPPLHIDPILDRWLNQKQHNGWNIIVFSTHSQFTQLPILSVSPLSATKQETLNSFEDQLPTSWQKIILENMDVPDSMSNILLLKIIQRTQDKKLIETVTQEKDSLKLWQEVLIQIRNLLSKNELQTLSILYIIKGQCSLEYLNNMVENSDMKNILRNLLWLHLMDTNLEKNLYWIPANLLSIMEQYNFFPDQLLFKIGNQVLVRELDRNFGKYEPTGIHLSAFYNALRTVHGFGDFKNSLTRCIQYGRKILRSQPIQSLLIENARVQIEIALQSDREDLIRKALTHTLEIYETLGLHEKTLEGYEWLLNSYQQNNQWDNVANIQTKQAICLTKLGQRQKAVNILTSVLNLLSDVGKLATQYQTIITIAILLIEMKEIQKVRDIVTTVNFDPKLLSPFNLARLHLIDGHLQIEEGNYGFALKALQKGLKHAEVKDSPVFLAMTYEAMGELFLLNNQFQEASEATQKAANIYEKSQEMNKSIELHQRLWKYFEGTNQWKEAVIHLNLLFERALENKETEAIQSLANALGGIYYKLGNQEKSIEYYKIANDVG